MKPYVISAGKATVRYKTEPPVECHHETVDLIKWLFHQMVMNKVNKTKMEFYQKKYYQLCQRFKVINEDKAA